MMRTKYSLEGRIKNFQCKNGKDDVEEVAYGLYERILEALTNAHASGTNDLKLFIKIKY